MNEAITLDGKQAGIIIQALESWVETTRERGDGLVLESGLAQAGWNCHDEANVGEALITQLDKLFPVEDPFE